MRKSSLERWLLGSLFVVLSSIAGTGRLRADDVGHCDTASTAIGYYYEDDAEFARVDGRQSFYAYTAGDCVTTSQNEAINTVATACLQGRVDRGTYGVGFGVVSWTVSWNDTNLTSGGPVEQQYDCGDVGPEPAVPTDPPPDEGSSRD